MKSRLSALGFGFLALGAVFCATPLYAADRTTAGEFITEPPTLLSLGFEWRIDGDDNRNAQVAVSYRRAGEQTWKAAPTLLRIGNERINENALQYMTPNGFAGSVFDLEPATIYEARFVLSDPRTLYKPADFDFQLRPGSVAVDAGVTLTGINDDFTGKAPDLGAYEVGKPVPHYGPR